MAKDLLKEKEKEQETPENNGEKQDEKQQDKPQKKPKAKAYRGPINHRIGNVIQFKNGHFSTDDPELQKLIESDMLFGTKICIA